MHSHILIHFVKGCKNHFLGHSLAELGYFQVLTSFIKRLTVGSHPHWKTWADAISKSLRTLTDYSPPSTRQGGGKCSLNHAIFILQKFNIVSNSITIFLEGEQLND